MDKVCGIELDDLACELKQARKYFQVPDVLILAVDTRGNITLLNCTGQTLLGYNELELLGKNWFESCIPKHSRVAVVENFLHIVNGNVDDGMRFECPVITQSGKERIIAWRGNRIVNAKGECMGVFAVGADVTEHRRTVEELREAKLQADAANRAKSVFMANISHELRTPMTAILGFCDLLSNSELPRNEQREFLATIRKNGESLLEIINNVLDLTTIETQQLHIQRTACSPHEVLAESVDSIRADAKRKGIRLTVLVDPATPKCLKTDPTRLHQILVNLLDNAVKFTDRGNVDVTLQYRKSFNKGERLIYSVQDSGIGISPDDLAKIFEPFTQADDSSTRRHGGSGLGLAVCQRLAKVLGGNIEATSELGRGSTFTLTLDIETASDAVPSFAAPPQTPALPAKGCVLLVEDNLDVQNLLARVIRGMNLDVKIAENGRIACEMAEKSMSLGRPFHAILMDIQMPEMDGYEATVRLRKHGWRRPIIALTAHATPEDRRKCLDAGCDEYFSKPVQLGEFRAAIQRFISRQESVSSTSSTMLSPPSSTESFGMAYAGA